MTYPSETVALILAAGQSRRMGTPKPLLPLEGETALEKSVNLFVNAGIQDIRIVTGHMAKTVRDRLPNLPVQWVHNEVYHQGMFSSVKKGVSTIGTNRSCFFILPVDIPLVRPRTLSIMLAARLSTNSEFFILHPTFMGRRGHPPLISTKLIPDILSWSGPDGLAGFMTLHKTTALEVAVIDEFIERDMDTPDDYRSLLSALSRYHIPTFAECNAMLADTTFFAEKTAAHCRMVARLATYFGETLAECNVPLDVDRITAGALLHDISKGEKNHAEAGAALLQEMGYAGISDIVATHADIEVPLASPITEGGVVFLADKLVGGDLLVPLSVRFERKLSKYGHDPSARAAILKRKAVAEAIAKRMEDAIGKSFQGIMEGFLQDTQ